MASRQFKLDNNRYFNENDVLEVNKDIKMSSKDYAIFLGCTIPVRGQSYEISARLVLKNYGFNLIDLDSFTCCGPTPIMSLNYLTAISISARNIAIAESKGLDILTLCSGCFEQLNFARSVLIHDKELKVKVNEILKESCGLEFKGISKVKHVAQVLFEEVPEGLFKSKLKYRVPLRLGTFYGCHLLRPSEHLKFDNPNDPKSLDILVERLGAESVNYQYKYECCGGVIKGTSPDTALKMSYRKVKSAAELGLEAIILACPFCYINLDRGQNEFIDIFEDAEFNLPILTITELIALAMGYSDDDLQLDSHVIDPSDIVEKIQDDMNLIKLE